MYVHIYIYIYKQCEEGEYEDVLGSQSDTVGASGSARELCSLPVRMLPSRALPSSLGGPPYSLCCLNQCSWFSRCLCEVRESPKRSCVAASDGRGTRVERDVGVSRFAAGGHSERTRISYSIVYSTILYYSILYYSVL